jgi:hypothetical protein
VLIYFCAEALTHQALYDRAKKEATIHQALYECAKKAVDDGVDSQSIVALLVSLGVMNKRAYLFLCGSHFVVRFHVPSACKSGILSCDF